MARTGRSRDLGLFARAATATDERRPAYSGGRLVDAQRLELLDSFEVAGLGCFWATDASGRITYLSETAVRNIRLSLDDLMQ